MRAEFWDSVLATRPKIKGDWLRILIYLSEHGQTSVTELAKSVSISKAHTSEFCKEMYMLGLINRFENVVASIKYVGYSINWHYRTEKINNYL